MCVRDKVYKAVAEAFSIKPEELTDSTNLLQDLNAKSVNYFPIMNELEEEYDLDIQYQEFRSNCPTVGSIVEFVESEI